MKLVTWAILWNVGPSFRRWRRRRWRRAASTTTFLTFRDHGSRRSQERLRSQQRSSPEGKVRCRPEEAPRDSRAQHLRAELQLRWNSLLVAAVDVDPESAAPETWWAEDRCSVLPGAGAAETRARPKSGSRVGLEEQNQSYLIMLDGLMKIQVHVVKKALVSIESVKV